MSQTSQSQSVKQELAEFVEYFNKYSAELHSKLNIASNSNDLYDLSEEFINLNQNFLINDEQNEQMLNEDFKQLIEKLNAFCSNYLNRVSFEQLMGNKFFKTSHLIIYTVVKYLLIRLRQNSLSQPDDSIKQDLIKMFNTIDLIVSYMSNSTNKNLKFELVDQLLLSILNSYSNIFFYLQSEIDLNDQMHTIKLELSQKLNMIIVKIANLIEKNLHDLNPDPNNLSLNTQINLNKFFKHIIYIINNLKEAKMVITLWRMLQKLINKNKQFTIESNLVSKFNQDKQFIINKAYSILDQEIHQNLKLIKFQLIKIGQNNESCSNDEEIQNNINIAISSTNTQCTMTNNLVLDTGKIIKLIMFYIKIFASLVVRHYVYLSKEYDEKLFQSMANILSLITSIFFLDVKFDIDFVLVDDDTKSNQDYEIRRARLTKTKNEFYQSKLDFFSQIKSGYEALFNLCLNKQDFSNYLNNSYFDKLIDQMIEQKQSATTASSLFQSQYKSEGQMKQLYDSSYFEDYLIFYLVYLNKVDLNNLKPTQAFENIFNSLNICQIAVGFPNYLTFYEQFFAKNYDFSELNNANFKSIEFYDFVLVNCSKFIARLLSSTNNDFDDDIVTFLIENLSLNKLEDEKDTYSQLKLQPLKIKLSNDLLILISIYYSKLTPHLTNYLKFICDMIEYKYGSSNYDDYDMINSHNISHLFIQILDYHTSNKNNKNFKQVLNNLEDYVKKNKMLICYSLLANYDISSDNKMIIDSFKLNSFTHLADLYKDLVDMLNDMNKTAAMKKNEQLLIKKTLAFIETKYFQQFLRIAINLLDYSNNNNNNDAKSKDALNKLNENLIVFLKLNELNNIFKYFENINNNTKLNFEYYKTLNLFIVDSITLYSLNVIHNDKGLNPSNDLMYFFDFLIKNCKSSNNNMLQSLSSQTNKMNNNKDMSMIKQKAFTMINNVKFSSVFFLKKLQSKEIISQKALFDKIIELFLILLNEPNSLIKYFSFETLSDYITNPVNNKLFVEVRKQCSVDMKTALDTFLLHSPVFSSDIDNLSIINDRFVQFFQAKYDANSLQVKDEMNEMNEDQDLIESMDHNENSNNLNDTMNLIMSAMDTTISATNPKINNREISYSPKLNSSDENEEQEGDEEILANKNKNADFNQLVGKIKKYSAKIIKIYEENFRCELMKTEIQDLIDYLSDAI